MTVPSIKLSSGHEMPMVGLGTWQSKPGEVGKALETALSTGYRHIDCAWVYGNQVEIGETLGKMFSSSHKREDVFITSKVWNTFHSTDACKKHVLNILDQLRLDYIDLMLIHWPMGYEEGGEPFPKRQDSDKMKYSDVDYLTTWKVLEDFVNEGKIRSIGISNFNHKQIERVISNSTIKPAVLQVELHPYFQQKKLRNFCKENGIAVTAYSSLGNPGSAFFRKDGDPNVLTDPVVKKIAEAHGKTTAQVALRWATQLDVIVIPKSTSEARIKENLALFDFKLTDVEMKEMEGLDRGWRIVDLTARDSDHPYFPFLEELLHFTTSETGSLPELPVLKQTENRVICQMPAPTVKLSSGYEMPLVGLGTWQSKPGEVGKAVEAAIKAGYTHLDCAWIYGNQVEVGETLKKLFSSSYKRENIFITSKVWNTFHSTNGCKKNVEEILKQLQLSYVDLMLIHWPAGYEEGSDPFPKRPGSNKFRYSYEDYLTTWKVLEEYVKQGRIRSIGISNFNHKQIDRVIGSAVIKPAVLQIECHPYLQQKKLRAYCKDKGIAVTAYSPLGNPGSAFFRKAGDPNILTDPVVKKIASAHGKTPAQIVLRWETQQDIIVIPKSCSEARIKENAAIFDFNLTDAEMKEIDGIDRGWRLIDLTSTESDHPHFPFLEEF